MICCTHLPCTAQSALRKATLAVTVCSISKWKTKLLTSSSSIYNCKTTFQTLIYLENKHCSCLTAENDLCLNFWCADSFDICSSLTGNSQSLQQFSTSAFDYHKTGLARSQGVYSKANCKFLKKCVFQFGKRNFLEFTAVWKRSVWNQVKLLSL